MGFKSIEVSCEGGLEPTVYDFLFAPIQYGNISDRLATIRYLFNYNFFLYLQPFSTKLCQSSKTDDLSDLLFIVKL